MYAVIVSISLHFVSLDESDHQKETRLFPVPAHLLVPGMTPEVEAEAPPATDTSGLSNPDMTICSALTYDACHGTCIQIAATKVRHLHCWFPHI